MRPLSSVPVLLLCLLCACACQRPQDLAGKYRAVVSEKNMELLLVLKSDGKGSWKVDREEVGFSWEQKGDEVVLHLKSGGVISGTPGKGDTIAISLPGTGALEFKRIER